jgi:desulfoferrodoxin (superoxide reductase-like protein)
MRRYAAGARPGVSRREFLGLASSAAVGLWLPRAWAAPGTADDAPRSNPEGEPPPVLRVPEATRNGAKVPIVVEMSHPMAADHYVTTVEVVNRRDPIPSKGRFHFTPANGRVYLAFQARVHHGASEVTAIAECSRHGRWVTRRPISIPEGAGG